MENPDFLTLFPTSFVFVLIFLAAFDAKTGAGGSGRYLKSFLEGVASS